MSEAGDIEEKERFVREWLRSGNPYKAALILYPSQVDVPKVRQIGYEWPNDPDCIRIREQMLVSADKADTMPDQLDAARFALEIIQAKHDTGAYVYTVRDRLAALDRYAVLRGFIKDKSAAELPSIDVVSEIVNALPD